MKESSHKHLRSALSKSGASAYEPRGSRMRRDSPYAHSTRSMEEDDDTLEEQGNEEEGKLSGTPLEDIHKAFIGF